MIFGNWGGGKCLLARWTSDWDCGYETSFWYVIKDSPYGIESLKSKRRYEIVKGRKHFTIDIVDTNKMGLNMYKVALKAFDAYPKEYRPIVEKNSFLEDVLSWNQGRVFGAFDSNNRLCAYSYVVDHGSYSELSVLKSDPEEEKNGVNAALMDGIMQAYNSILGVDGYYICDGSRAISHKTHFQDYLEKYFGFRKAFCILHIKYRWFISVMLMILRPFYVVLASSKLRIAHNIASVIAMDSYKGKK